MPLDKIEANITLQKGFALGAPFYVLGALYQLLRVMTILRRLLAEQWQRRPGPIFYVM